MSKVLVVATSRKTRGGITSVIKAHETGKQWNKYHCKWIETHRDTNKIIKLLYALKGFISFLVLFPFYDIIHFHVSFQGSLTRKYYMNRIAKFFHKKTIVHFHPPTPDVIFQKENFKKYNNLFNSTDLVIVLSNHWSELIKKEYGENVNTKVLYNPCPLVENIKNDRDKSNDRYILFAGTLIERKGYECLIKAFANIINDFPDWKLVLAGNGETDKAKKMIEDYKATQSIILKGWIDRESMNELYNNASIYCLASSGEGFPMVVLEAWAYGVPVVTTLVGGLPDIVIDGVNALTFDYNNVEQLQEQLSKLMLDSSLRKKLSEEGIKLSKEVFNINVINKELENIYANLSK